MIFTDKISVRLIRSMGGDQAVIDAARVSTGSKPDPERDAGLISYLMKNRHGSPFEHSCMTFEVHAPIFVWREWHRHRIGFSYNEESARYKKLEPVFYIPPDSRPMYKVENWKPGRPSFRKMESEADVDAYDMLCVNLEYSYKIAYEMYEENMALGIDPGLARACLPVGIYSTCFVTCNPRSLMAFLSLRTHNIDSKFASYPLYEIEVAARVAEDIFARGWPITYNAFCDNGRVAP